MGGQGPLPRPAPAIVPETARFWQEAAFGRLVLQRCSGCEAVVWYPRAHCPVCSGTELDWFRASGRGRIYSFTINRRPEGAFAETGEYVLAYVELEEGPRLLTNIVTPSPATVRVGQPVRAVFEGGDDPTWALVRFEVLDAR